MSCVICLEPTTSSPKKLPCGHKFHKHCIKRWVDRYNSCPVCRQAVNKKRPIKACLSTFLTDDDGDVALRLHRQLNGLF